MKAVPKGNKGLAKLPQEVRNKMGYYKGGGKVTKEMADEMDYKSKNEANAMAKEISETLKRGYKEVNGFPRPLTAAQKSSLEKEMARIQKQLGKKPNYRYVGTDLPEGDAPFEDDAMFYGGGRLGVKAGVGEKLMKKAGSKGVRKFKK